TGATAHRLEFLRREPDRYIETHRRRPALMWYPAFKRRPGDPTISNNRTAQANAIFRRHRTDVNVKERWSRVNMPNIYSISELAREMTVTTRAIRFYEEQGLLLPERCGQKRLYSQRDRVTLELIMRGKRIGLSLAECKDLISMYDPAGGNSMQLSRLLETIGDRRQQLKRQVLDIQKMQAE